MCEGNRTRCWPRWTTRSGAWASCGGALASTGGLAATVKAGYAGRMRWSATREPLEHQVVVGRGRTICAELREIGRLGEVVTGWA